MRSGKVRTRSGDLYKPSAIRGYERALRDRVLPEFGSKRLGDVQRRDVQRLADDLLGEGLDPSTVRNVLMPLRVIYRTSDRGRRPGRQPDRTPPVAGGQGQT